MQHLILNIYYTMLLCIMQIFLWQKKKYKNNRIILKKDIYEIVILVRIVIIVFLKHFSLHIYFLSLYRIENRIFTFIINFIFYYKINH